LFRSFRLAATARRPHAWLVALAGVVSMLFGIAMFVWPGVGLLTLVYLVGSYAIVYGIITCMLAFRLHSPPERMPGMLVPPRRSGALALGEHHVPRVVLSLGGPATWSPPAHSSCACVASPVVHPPGGALVVRPQALPCWAADRMRTTTKRRVREREYQVLGEAVKSGRITAKTGARHPRLEPGR
jgi:hypothetical protein